MIWPFKRRKSAPVGPTVLAEVPRHAARQYVNATASDIRPGPKTRDVIAQALATALRRDDIGLTSRSDALLASVVGAIEADGIEITGPPELVNQVAEADALAVAYLEELSNA